MWRYVYRAVDQHSQVIDVYVSPKGDIAAARRFFTGALAGNAAPVEVVTDKAPALATNVIRALLPTVFHNTEQYANNRVECDHGRLKARTQNRHLRQFHHSRSGSHTERETRTLRTRCRSTKSASSHRCGIRRTIRKNLSTRNEFQERTSRADRNATLPIRSFRTLIEFRSKRTLETAIAANVNHRALRLPFRSRSRHGFRAPVGTMDIKSWYFGVDREFARSQRTSVYE